MPACEERKRKTISIFRINEFAELPDHTLPRPSIVRWSNTSSIYILTKYGRYPSRETDVRSKRRAARSLSMLRDKTSATSTSVSASVIGPNGPACVPIPTTCAQYLAQRKVNHVFTRCGVIPLSAPTLLASQTDVLTPIYSNPS
jgi:hypothetical protein